MNEGPVTFDQYRQIQATNWSALKWIRESPLKYQFMRSAEDQDTVARAVGRAGHCALFEPHEFERLFFVLPESAPKDLRYLRHAKKPSPDTVAAIEWWDAQEVANAGRTMLTDEHWRQATGIAQAVRSHPLVSPYIDAGEFEKTVTWTDPASGERCKARIDWWAKKQSALLDLKTSGSIDSFRFGAIAARLGYNSQLAFYYNAVRFGMGQACAEVAIVAVESKPPHDVAWFTVDDAALYAGQQEVARLIEQLQECRASNRWPGRYTEKQSLLLPQYVYGDDEIAITEGA